MLSNNNGTPVHFPSDPQKFAFDEEVAKIFPNMAERSIPHFLAAHKAHAKIVAASPDIKAATEFCVLDVGASRGHFYQYLLGQGLDAKMSYTAVDSSAPMCALMREEFPDIEVLEMDVTGPDFVPRLHQHQWDVVYCNYVLQFLPQHLQAQTLMRLCEAVKPGGLFFLGHKSQHSGWLGEQAHELYVQWRIANGYSRAEVEAKTAALKGSMFPMRHGWVLSVLDNYFSEVQETTRFMMFSTVAARK